MQTQYIILNAFCIANRMCNLIFEESDEVSLKHYIYIILEVIIDL